MYIIALITLQKLKSSLAELIPKCDHTTALGNKVALCTSNEGSLLIKQDITSMQVTIAQLRSSLGQVEDDLDREKRDISEYCEMRNTFSLWLTSIETHTSDIDGSIELDSLEKLNLDAKVSDLLAH